MALLTLQANGTNIDIIGGSIDMPLNGIWIADLIIDQTQVDTLTAAQQVIIADNTNTFSLIGSVALGRNGIFLDAVHTRVIGGQGGLSKPTLPHAKQSATVKDILNDLMADSGETLSTTSDSGFTNTSVSFWSVFGGIPVSTALTSVINRFAQPNTDWRFLPDGTLFIGQETWTPANTIIDFEMLETNPIEGTFRLGVSSPYFLPGMSIPDIGNISRVLHDIGQDKIRSNIWITLDQPNRTIQNSISDLVSAALPNINYLTTYDAKLTAQSSDFLNVDITPVNTALPGMQNIPIFYGVAGITTEIDTSNSPLCKLAWSEGDPSKPYVYGFPADAIKSVSLLNSGSDKISMGSNDIALTINGSVIVDVKQSVLTLGSSSATDFAVLGTSFNTAFNNLLTALTAFTTAINTFGTAANTFGLTAGTALATAANAFLPQIATLQGSNYLSSIVKIQT